MIQTWNLAYWYRVMCLSMSNQHCVWFQPHSVSNLLTLLNGSRFNFCCIYWFNLKVQRVAVTFKMWLRMITTNVSMVYSFTVYSNYSTYAISQFLRDSGCTFVTICAEISTLQTRVMVFALFPTLLSAIVFKQLSAWLTCIWQYCPFWIPIFAFFPAPVATRTRQLLTSHCGLSPAYCSL